ncbi:MAG: hypothetical protein AB7G12_17505 [Thermoanaerobaculia bacterium]
MLQLVGFGGIVFSLGVTALGSKLFVGRKEMKTNWTTLTKHIDEQNAEVRTAMQTELGSMGNRITRDLGGLEKQADERYRRSCDDMKRMESMILNALTEAKAANQNATLALRSGERAELVAGNAEKNTEAAASRQDRQIEALQNRQRRSDP